MATKNKKKRAKKPAKKLTADQTRPTSVDYVTVTGGRRNRDGKPADLYARIEVRNGKTSVSLGSDYNKLQIRVTKEALAEVLERMA